ncbi:protein NRT1/ PTR FAMILY 2.7-like [Primulina huaijiensis]|uniref:protein NRT1/ PTR FAMILY 2.7-like n=1 Tax=Primulina huaijiensis TaxID=1492673 RepID=UPI003CC736CD
MENSGEREALLLTPNDIKRGSWNAFPFFIGTVVGLQLAGGWLSNLIVYLIDEFNINRIDAAQISSIVSGTATLIPVAAAVVADSFLGCFSVIFISFIIYLLGLILLLLTATLDNLRPNRCENGSDSCVPPSSFQYAVVYVSLALTTMGLGGTCYTITTMGASQFSSPKDRNRYFNWYYFTAYVSSLVTSTGIVYIEDNLSWAWGFSICLAANMVGLAIFLIGSRYYYFVKPQGSPFMGFARVIVASVRKRKIPISSQITDYYYGDHVGDNALLEAPTLCLRSLNRAALKTEGGIQENGTISKQWKLCTVQQVEDLKTLIQILPLWSTAILLATPIGIQMSLSVLQALTMDRQMVENVRIPAATMLVFTFIFTALSLGLFDHIIWPVFKKVTWIDRDLTPLQRIGIGHVFNVASMAVSAVVESKRRAIAWYQEPESGANVGSMSVFWLVPQLALVGIAEAFHYPGQISLYYQEFPNGLKSMATAMISLIIGMAFYLSGAVIEIVRSVTDWLPDDINNGRLENVYWVLVVLGVFNFGYYALCSWIYKYKNNVHDHMEEVLE